MGNVKQAKAARSARHNARAADIMAKFEEDSAAVSVRGGRVAGFCTHGVFLRMRDALLWLCARCCCALSVPSL